jgi:hypothetical protein
MDDLTIAGERLYVAPCVREAFERDDIDRGHDTGYRWAASDAREASGAAPAACQRAENADVWSDEGEGE